MITRRHPHHAASLPVLAAAFAPTGGAATGDTAATPSARAVARLYPLGEGSERILLAVAEGLDDPLSAEAQAAEALGRLEAVVARGAGDALPEDLLDAGAQAAAEGVHRLNALPGSLPNAGVALVAAIVEEGSISLLNAGHGAVFLQRGGSVRRLTGATSDGTVLGSGGETASAVSIAERLQTGDALLVASERIARGLGERVIEAVFDEYGAEGVADELAGLAGGLPDAAGAAVALLQVPGGGTATAATAGGSAVPVDDEPVVRPRWLVPLAIVGAIVLGVLVAGAIAFALSRGGRNRDTSRAAAPSPATQVAVAPTILATLPSATAIEATAAASPSPAATATPAVSATAGASATPASTPVPSATPSSLANLPACSGGAESKPCSYTAQPGDSLSVIGDRFDITRACFESANLNHEPLAPRPPDYRIGVGESYIIPNEVTCATLPPVPAPPPAAATAPATTSAPTAATAPAATPAPRPALTPPPGAANPTRAASAAAGGAATAAPAAAAPARRGPCTPVPGEQFPRPTC
ncbi:MAG TPA: LysM domain-containing protein [Dehalococcoidia bacterium]|nr:LysM domain-containing protein [Dehalococcoidia bacterium]